jgi:cysteine desulfuration protein SufE
MAPSFQKKIEQLKALFEDTSDDKEKYELILKLGRALPPFPEESKKPENRVEGCQSTTYLIATCEKGKMHFQATSDALISAGLVAILVQIYDNEAPTTILHNPPTFIHEIGLNTHLSPLRASGLAQMYQKMFSLAQKCL